jgi:hypothetical protein
MDLRSRKGFKLITWSLLTVLVVLSLATGSDNTVHVVWCAGLLGFCMLTIALLLSGRNPRWARSAHERGKKFDPSTSAIQRWRERRRSNS